MTVTADDAQRLIHEGVAAMQRRDPRAARDAFAAACDCPAIAPPLLPLAQACHALGDRAGEETALDRLLAIEPRNLRALLMKGEARIAAGDDRAATSFLNVAIKSADAQQPPVLAAQLVRAQQWLAGAASRYETHLRGRLDGAGLPPSSLQGRVGAAMAMLSGRRALYLQQPSSFYFPGLPQIDWYDRTDFAWAEALEAETDAIHHELAAVMADDRDFPAYVQGEGDRPRSRHTLLDDPSWGAFHLLKGGLPVPGNADRCPRTIAALGQAPMPAIRGRSPMALFSLLKPGTHIRPHHGLLNTRLICHLPLIVPPGCAMRVGAETREWQRGKLTIFDDSFEHEAWNHGRSTRVILLFEIWRPEISAEERAALTVLFEAIGDYGGFGEED
ncbi:aspartyl/asparaginyl beta-hydroxylase domain-containing protein [Sphingomonas sp. 1P06PA]|uniref:aspartyl/asparaginyl beta-hydroxylase domain-containing protein n=1 Tax=Sphingomonas sp. 1P06PA TaxID=554121 RepID=UPI0039A72DAB